MARLQELQYIVASGTKVISGDLEYLRLSAMMCSADATTQKKEIKEDCLYDFLVGLDPSLDQVRSQVLAQDPLPYVCNSFAFVRSEKLYHDAMMAVKFHDGVAMVAGTSSRPLPKVSDITSGYQAFVPSQADQSVQQVPLANASTSLGNT
ncbi:hypothetical protein FCV25MIE_15406, partial [Fagus crenata]